MKRTITKKQCMKYRKVESFANKKGCDIRPGKGDHMIISYNDNQIVYARREMGYGLACTIWRWFKLMGFLAIIAIPIFMLVLIFA
jgi:hypothetical protein